MLSITAESVINKKLLTFHKLITKTYFMKLTLLLFLAFIANIIYAQKDAIVRKPSQRAQSVYGELGGNGILFSANYDVRFANSQKGLGARIGVGYLIDIFTFPVAINYLVGRSPNLFEAGIGYTYVTDTFNDHGSAAVFSAGYRYQPIASGFTARVFISPLVDTEEREFIFFGGISFGFKF